MPAALGGEVVRHTATVGRLCCRVLLSDPGVPRSFCGVVVHHERQAEAASAARQLLLCAPVAHQSAGQRTQGGAVKCARGGNRGDLRKRGAKIDTIRVVRVQLNQVNLNTDPAGDGRRPLCCAAKGSPALFPAFPVFSFV